MAITINSIPASYTSAHDALWHVVTSNNVGSTNFKYVFDVLINGATVASFKVYPDPNNLGIIDFGPIVRNYFASQLVDDGSGFVRTADGFLHVDYSIRYGEEYNGVTYPNLTSATYKGWNFSLDPFRNPITTYANKFLTSRDRSDAKVISGESFLITYFNSDLSNTLTATIQNLNEDGSNNGSASTGTNFLASAVHGIILDLSPTSINSYLGITKVTASTYAYRVSIGADSIVITQTCAQRFTPVQIVFQNQYGGYDQFAFRLLSKQSRKMDRKTYTRAGYEINVETKTMDFKNSSNVFYGGTRSFTTGIDYSYLVISDYLTLADYNLGAELIASNEIYFKLNGNYYPIVFTATTWQEKVQTSDKIFNYELNFNLGIKQFSQFK
jgi:hypothetical protein